MTAPERLPSPPMTTTIKAASTGLRPISGSTEPRCMTHSTPAMPARSPEMRNARAMRREALMPMRRTISNSVADARIAQPIRVLKKKNRRSTRLASDTIMEMS